MPAPPASLLVALRVVEALLLSGLAGLFVWLLGVLFVPVPLLSPAFAGLLAGGAASMRTFGVAIHRRGWRIALAVVCAALAYLTMQTLVYREFVHFQRRGQRAADYAASPAEVDRRIDEELRTKTGADGIAGYLLAALGQGVPHLGLRWRRAALVAYWLAELGAAGLTAARWAGGASPERPLAGPDRRSSSRA